MRKIIEFSEEETKFLEKLIAFELGQMTKEYELMKRAEEKGQIQNEKAHLKMRRVDKQLISLLTEILRKLRL